MSAHRGQSQHGEQRGEGQGDEEDLADAHGQVLRGTPPSARPPRDATAPGTAPYRWRWRTPPAAAGTDGRPCSMIGRRRHADERGHHGAYERVEVDYPQADDHRPQQHPHPPAPRDGAGSGARASASSRRRGHELGLPTPPLSIDVDAWSAPPRAPPSAFPHRRHLNQHLHHRARPARPRPEP